MEARTQAELAYTELTHRILVLEIAPRERIKEHYWAKKLQVNRAAIRESLTRLLGEGMVFQGERGGYFASQITEREIDELREVREILETSAFSLACDRATDGQVAEIKEACEDFSNFVKKRYFTGAHEADLRFHRLLVAAAGNARLLQLYQRSHIFLFQRPKSHLRVNLDDFMQTENEHRLILGALEQRDKKLGIRYLKEHFSRDESEPVSLVAKSSKIAA